MTEASTKRIMQNSSATVRVLPYPNPYIYKKKDGKKICTSTQKRKKKAITGKRAAPSRTSEIETLPWLRNDKFTTQLCFLLMLY